MAKEKRCSAAKSWEGCAYNFEPQWMVELVEVFKRDPEMNWTVGEEVGERFGIPHLQIGTDSKRPFRPMERFKVSFNISWVKSCGKKKDIHAYARKGGQNVHTNVYRPPSIDVPDVMQIDELPEWSKRLIGKVADKLPDKRDRSIHWFWSESGQMHKTETARYLVSNHGAVVVQGGRKHVLAVGYKNPAPIYILLVPRTDEGFVSYASIELLKDSLYMSAFGVEATGGVNRAKPWVICVANFPPTLESVSEDRWVIENVDSGF